jgi:hypothetical protein
VLFSLAQEEVLRGTRIKRGFVRGDKREKKEERAKVVFVEDALA